MMDKSLKLYYNDGNSDLPFPSGMKQAEIFDFNVSISRMGNAPTISAKLDYPICLDDEWNALCPFDEIFAEFRGERYYLKNTPSSEKSNDKAFYTHNLNFVCERQILEKVYMIDDNENQTQSILFSNNTQFTFFGDIAAFAERINQSMYFSGIGDSCMYSGGQIVPIGQRTPVGDGYYIVVDAGVVSEGKLVTFSDSKVSDGLAQIFSVFGIPYYFKGRIIHIGDYEPIAEATPEFSVNGILGAGINAFGNLVPYEYGHEHSMLNVSRNNDNKEVYNRCSGKGSDDNIPYYYPNPTPSGTIRHQVTAQQGSTLSDNNVTIDDPLKFSSLNDTDALRYVFANAISTDHIVVKGVYEDGRPYENPHFINFPMEDFGAGGSEYYGVVIRVRVDFEIKKEYAQVGLNFIRQFPTGVHFRVTRPDGVVMPGNGTYCNMVGRNLLDADGNYILGKYSIEFDVMLEPSNPYQPQGYFDLTELIDEINYDDATQQQRYMWFGVINSNQKYWSLESSGLHVELEDYGVSIASGVTLKNGDKIKKIVDGYVTPQKNLMPSCYRLSGGNKKFYPAKNYPLDDISDIDTEIGEEIIPGGTQVENDNYKDSNNTYYHFDNVFRRLKQNEHIEDFHDIKPTIKEMTNAMGQRIDMFRDIAFDLNDDNSGYYDDNNNFVYNHPYFFVRLRFFNGANGFNLFDHAIDESEMTIAMTSGDCAPCEFRIMVSEDQKNLVQVDSSGVLLRDEDGDVICGRKGESVFPLNMQNDTQNYSVWIALEKDIDTYGEIMPYLKNGNVIRPKACTSSAMTGWTNDGDTFVILHIALPYSYVTAAEQRLTKEIIRWMYENNSEKFNVSLKFSRVFIGHNPGIEPLLSSNIKVSARYNGITKEYFVTNYSYKMSASSPLPEIELTGLVETVEELKATATSKSFISKVGEHIADNFSELMMGFNKPFTRIIKQNNTTVNNQIKGEFPADYAITKEDLQNGSVIVGADGRFVKKLNGGVEGQVLKMIGGIPSWGDVIAGLYAEMHLLQSDIVCTGNDMSLDMSHVFDQTGVYFVSADIQFHITDLSAKSTKVIATLLNALDTLCSGVCDIAEYEQVNISAIVEAHAEEKLYVTVNAPKFVSVLSSFSIGSNTYANATSLKVIKLR